MRSISLRVVGLVASCFVVFAAIATEIQVQPGNGTLEAALSTARSGDVLKLAPGEYGGAVTVPEGVTIRGAGADNTRLTGAGHALISVSGPRVTLAELELTAEKDTERGVDSSFSVRIEGCRFNRFSHAVALTGAPLSDVIACEFRDCNIGVRAIAQASPTIWGCRFEGGQQGIFVMDGAPYIRNNLFFSLDVGIRHSSEEAAIIRNNVFWKCKTHGVLIMQPREAPLYGPSVRNNIFVQCGDAVAGPADLLTAVSHAVMFEAGRSPLGIDLVGPSLNRPPHHIVITDPGLTLADDGNVAVKNTALTAGQGIRLCGQAAEEKGDIGLMPGATRPGCAALQAADVPPPRFAAPLHVVNAVVEEYVYLRSEQCEILEQYLHTADGRRIEVLKVKCGGQSGERRFDVSRFFGETLVDTE